MSRATNVSAGQALTVFLVLYLLPDVHRSKNSIVGSGLTEGHTDSQRAKGKTLTTDDVQSASGLKFWQNETCESVNNPCLR